MTKTMKLVALLLCVLCALCLAGCKNAAEDSGSGGGVVDPGPCLTFKGNADFTLGTASNTKYWDGKVYYSTDATKWQEWDGTSAISSVSNCLYLRGKNKYFAEDNSSKFTNFVLGGSAKEVECTGNIMTLLDYENPDTISLSNYCFCGLFKDCTTLTQSPELPATAAVSYCYNNMFWGCTALKSVGKIAGGNPIDLTGNSCFAQMFRGCSSLKVYTATDTATETNHFIYIGNYVPGYTIATASMFKDCGGETITNVGTNTKYIIK